jgi:hypothetical protein
MNTHNAQNKKIIQQKTTTTSYWVKHSAHSQQTGGCIHPSKKLGFLQYHECVEIAHFLVLNENIQA